MTEIRPQDVLFRTGGRCLELFGVSAVSGYGKGYYEELPEQFTRADATTCATAIDRDGLLRRAAAGCLRTEFVDLDGDGIRETLTLLYEGTSTNLCLRSEEFDNAAWVNGGTPVVTANTDVAPDGTVSADTLTDDDAAQFESKQQTFAVANDSLSHVFGIFVKKTVGATNTFAFNMSLSGGAGVASNPRLNTNTGVVTGGLDTRAISVGNYWLFMSRVTNNTSGNTVLTIAVYPASGTNVGNNPGADNVAATGSAVVWGANLQKAPFLGSYIKTQGAAVTRATDLMRYAIGFPPMDVTIYWKIARPLLADSISGISGIFDIGDAGTNHAWTYIDKGAGSYFISVGDGTPTNRSVTPAIPAGAFLSGIEQLELFPKPRVIGDVGGGPTAPSAQTPLDILSWQNQRIQVGGIANGNNNLWGNLVDLIIVRGKRTKAEMEAIP